MQELLSGERNLTAKGFYKSLFETTPTKHDAAIVDCLVENTGAGLADIGGMKDELTAETVLPLFLGNFRTSELTPSRTILFHGPPERAKPCSRALRVKPTSHSFRDVEHTEDKYLERPKPSVRFSGSQTSAPLLFLTRSMDSWTAETMTSRPCTARRPKLQSMDTILRERDLVDGDRLHQPLSALTGAMVRRFGAKYGAPKPCEMDRLSIPTTLSRRVLQTNTLKHARKETEALMANLKDLYESACGRRRSTF